MFQNIRRAIQEHRAKAHGTTIEKMEAYETAQKNELYRARLQADREAKENYYKQRAEHKYKAKLERGQRLKNIASSVVKSVGREIKTARHKKARMGIGLAANNPSPFSSNGSSPFSLGPSAQQKPARQKTITIRL
jgi:hypothetical protein